jgi:Outer membrane protein beta-barrel domain
MKKSILPLFVALFSLNAFAENRGGDTTKIKWNTSTRVWIFHEKPSVQSDSLSHQRQKPSKKEFIHWAGLDLGVCMLSTIDNKLKISAETDSALMNNFLDLNYSKSLFFSFNPLEKNFRLYRNYLNLVTGAGIEWNSYNFKRNITLNPDAPYISTSNTMIAPDSIKYQKNKLKVTYLKVPLLIELNTNSENPEKSFHISGGVEFAYKIASKTKQKYEINGYEVNTKRKDDYHLADFKYSGVVRIGYGNYFTLFANYGLSQVFENNNGPALFPLTMGVSIDF